MIGPSRGQKTKRATHCGERLRKYNEQKSGISKDMKNPNEINGLLGPFCRPVAPDH
jgi:hypothetical protein